MRPSHGSAMLVAVCQIYWLSAGQPSRSLRHADEYILMSEQPRNQRVPKYRIVSEPILSSTDAYSEGRTSCAKLGRNSAHRFPEGLGGSNPPLSTIQSPVFGILFHSA